MNRVFYTDREGQGFGAENPDEPAKAGYGFFFDEISRKIMLWVESELSDAEAVAYVHRLRKRLLKKHLWGPIRR